MAKPQNKSSSKNGEHKQGIVDRLLHGDHSDAEGSDGVNSNEEAEDDVPMESKPSSKNSKHEHPKFDKFKKGN